MSLTIHFFNQSNFPTYFLQVQYQLEKQLSSSSGSPSELSRKLSNKIKVRNKELRRSDSSTHRQKERKRSKENGDLSIGEFSLKSEELKSNKTDHNGHSRR